MTNSEAVFAWCLRYVDHMMKRSDIDRESAQESAQVASEEQQANVGDDVSQWESPEYAAEEEMSYWDNDGDEPEDEA